jgi:hypothetical protein
MPTLDSFDVKFGVGPLSVGGKWSPDKAEAEAAWELYVELITRAAVVELGSERGLLRETFTSLYSLFGTTRQILKDKGPGVARPKQGGDYSFGYLAVTILNFAVRPFLERWHPELQHWEADNTDPRKSPKEHEIGWKYNDQVRAELKELNGVLREYSNLLARVSGVPNLLEE